MRAIVTTSNQIVNRVRQLFFISLCLAVFVGVVWGVLHLADSGDLGLTNEVQKELKNSGSSNPVAAVLLNFRGYDTLLEMAVLMIAVFAVWSLDALKTERQYSPVDVLETLVRLLISPLILVAFYVLWVGGQSAGGAFQAGAILGAAGVLLLLAGWQVPYDFSQGYLRVATCFGLIAFLAVATIQLMQGRALLEYISQYSKAQILAIELAAAISIGVSLTLLFLAVSPKEGDV